MKRAVLFVAALLMAAALWELYKQFGPEDGGEVLGWTILPRANDTAMPHVWDMLSRYAEPDRRGSDRDIWRVVLAGAWYSFRLAVFGFALGVAVGSGAGGADGAVPGRRARVCCRIWSCRRRCR